MAIIDDVSTNLQNPRDFVQAGWDYYRDLTTDWIERSRSALDNLQYIGVAPAITFEVPIELQVDYGSFVRPTPPELPELSPISVTLPVAPTLDDITVAPLAAAPEEPDFSGLAYTRPAAPSAPIPTRPSDTDLALVDITLPDAPDYTLPSEPSLYALTLIDIPDLTLPEFEGVRPTLSLTAPAKSFAFSPAAHDTTLIDTLKSRLTLLINGEALPEDVEAAIFDRARGREDVLTLQATQEAFDGLASRGLRQPAGLAARARERIAHESRLRSSGANRDLSIRIAELNHEAIKTGIAQGIALEGELLRYTIAGNDQLLRAAQAAQEVDIALFNAQVALHNAEVEAFKADAVVFGERIRALQAQADVLKTRIEQQKAIGEVNETLVRAYAERLRAVAVLTDVYKTNVEAAKATGEINVQRLEQQRLRLQAYATDVDAWGKLHEAHRINVEAELGSMRAYEILSGVYGRRIDAWKTQGEADFQRARVLVDVQGQALDRYRAALTGAQIDAQTQLAQLDARIREYGTRGTVFGSQAQMVAAESAAHDRNMQIRLEAARMRIETAQKNLELEGNYALKRVDQSIEATRAQATVLAQLAASTLSGVNFGASYTGSLSNNVDVNYNFSGEL